MKGLNALFIYDIMCIYKRKRERESHCIHPIYMYISIYVCSTYGIGYMLLNLHASVSVYTNMYAYVGIWANKYAIL